MNNDSWIIIADNVPFASLPPMAKGMGGRITAIVVGSRERAEAVAALNVDEVICYTTDETVPAEAWAGVIAEAAEQAKPRLILAANNAASRAIMGIVAARLGAGVTASIKEISMEGEQVVVKHLVAEGRAIEVLGVDGCVAGTIVDGAEEDIPTGKTAEITVAAVVPAECVKLISSVAEAGGVDLSSADRVVGVGIGIGTKENIAIAEKHEPGVKCGYVERFDFYDRTKNAYATVSTGETAAYGCVILKKGCL